VETSCAQPPILHTPVLLAFSPFTQTFPPTARSILAGLYQTPGSPPAALSRGDTHLRSPNFALPYQRYINVHSLCSRNESSHHASTWMFARALYMPTGFIIAQWITEVKSAAHKLLSSLVYKAPSENGLRRPQVASTCCIPWIFPGVTGTRFRQHALIDVPVN